MELEFEDWHGLRQTWECGYRTQTVLLVFDEHVKADEAMTAYEVLSKMGSVRTFGVAHLNQRRIKRRTRL